MIKKNILLVSMPSIHMTRWISNIDMSTFNVYWFDVLERGKQNFNSEVTQFTNWKKRIFPPLIGEHKFKKYLPTTFIRYENMLSTNPDQYLLKLVESYNIDIIHSFEMQSCTYPFIKLIPNLSIPWLYSCWGSDIFYYREFEYHEKKISKILKSISGIHVDNNRDLLLARSKGFNTEHILHAPGGGGFIIRNNSRAYNAEKKDKKQVILIKGYQHRFGRSLTAIKAFEKYPESLDDFKLIVFAAHESVYNYVQNSPLQITCYRIGELSHEQLLALMSKSLIYIGNSISDGIPNTLLESMVCGVFPIQSNPGNVTSELINDRINGLLIDEPENVDYILQQIIWVLKQPMEFFIVSSIINKSKTSFLEYDNIRGMINAFYVKSILR